jgi:hypothetical protein
MGSPGTEKVMVYVICYSSMADCCSVDFQHCLDNVGVGCPDSLEAVHGYLLGREVRMDPPVSEEDPGN